MADAKAGGADDGEVMVLQQLINRADRAVGAVFNGQNAELAKTGLHGGDHRVKGLHIHDIAPGQDAVAGHLAVGALHALAGHQPRLGEDGAAGLQGGLHLGGHLGGGADQLCLAGAGKLKEGGIEVVGVALPGLAGLFRDLGQHGALPLLIQNRLLVGVFIGRHLIGQGHALQEELEKLVINGVDFYADIRKFHDFPP